MLNKINNYQHYFFAFFTVLFFLQYNQGEALFKDSLWTLLFVAILTVVLDIAARIIINEKQKRPFVISVTLFFILSYGNIYSFIQSVAVLRHRYLLVMCILLYSLIIYIWLKQNKITEIVSRSFTVASLLLFLSSLSGVLKNEVLLSSMPAPRLAAASEKNSVFDGDKPDVYYIILDGYTREDILRTTYEYDNSAFIKDLQCKGFYIAHQSNSNYNRTIYSLPSSFNMEYLDAESGQLSLNKGQLTQKIRDNHVAEIFKSLGYSTYCVGHHWIAGHSTTASFDKVIYYPGIYNVFFNGYVYGTIFRVFYERFISPYKMHVREKFILDQLESPPNTKTPKFIFAHILPPHEPYVFSADGSMNFNVMDFNTSIEKARKGYIDQIKFVNFRISKIVEKIFRTSKTPPVIIIQGDHGWTLEEKGDSAKKERMAILNAYLVPEAVKQRLYENITPVNSFRLIFSGLFGADYPLLPDRSYFIDDTVADVTETLRKEQENKI